MEINLRFCENQVEEVLRNEKNPALFLLPETKQENII